MDSTNIPTIVHNQLFAKNYKIRKNISWLDVLNIKIFTFGEGLEM